MLCHASALINSVETTKLRELITSFSAHSANLSLSFSLSFSGFSSLSTIFLPPLALPYQNPVSFAHRIFWQCGVLRPTIALIPSFLSSSLELPGRREGRGEQNKLRTMKISSTRSSFSDGTISIHGITRISFESFQVADKGRGLSSRHVQFTADTSIYLDEHVMAGLYFRTS